MTTIQDISQRASKALMMSHIDVYDMIICFMQEGNPIMAPDLEEIKESLHTYEVLEEGNLPWELSDKYFGRNIFQFDVFDYYMMAYEIVHQGLMFMFIQLEREHDIKYPERYQVIRDNIIGIFDEVKNRTTPNYPYATAMFKDFLDQRLDWLLFLEYQIEFLKEVVDG
jgi:hypothetical protein